MFLIISEIYLFLFRTHVNLGDSVLKQVYIYGKPSVKPNEDGSIPAISMKAVNFCCCLANL